MIFSTFSMFDSSHTSSIAEQRLVMMMMRVISTSPQRRAMNERASERTRETRLDILFIIMAMFVLTGSLHRLGKGHSTELQKEIQSMRTVQRAMKIFSPWWTRKDDRTKQIKEDDEQVRSDNLFELSLSMMTSDFLHSFNENNTLLISNEFFYWKVEEEEKVGFSSSPSEFDWSFVEWSAVADDEPDGHFAKFPRLCSGMAALWNSYRCENTMNRCFVGLQRESGLVMNVGFRRFSTPSRTIEQLHRSLPFPRRSLPTSTSLDFLLLLSFFH